MFIKGDYPYLAASPDGMFTCKCCNPATIEVKCPYSVRNENLHNLEAYKRVEFLEDVMGEPRLKRSHKYYTQMQAQMWAAGADHGYWTQRHKPLYECGMMLRYAVVLYGMVVCGLWYYYNVFFVMYVGCDLVCVFWWMM